MTQLTEDAQDGPDLVGACWREYSRTRGSKPRDQLIRHYLELARRIAARLYRQRHGEAVAFDDYLQYARTGLIEAVDRYNPDLGVPFEAYATHRVRGAILNGLDSESEQAAQRKAGLPLVMLDRVRSISHVSLEEDNAAQLGGWMNTVVGIALGLLLENGLDGNADASHAGNPYAHVELLYLRRRMLSFLDKLPEREAQVVRLHYFEYFEFQHIANRLGVTKGRVSQIHASALTRLRKMLGDQGRLNTYF